MSMGGKVLPLGFTPNGGPEARRSAVRAKVEILKEKVAESKAKVAGRYACGVLARGKPEP